MVGDEPGPRTDRPSMRRAFLRQAVSLVAAGPLTVGLPRARQATAAPADPAAGPALPVDPVTGRIDPLPAIRRSGVRVAITDFATPPPTSATRPRANLNYLFHAGDGLPFVYACDTRGKLWRIQTDTGAISLFLDAKDVRGAALLTTGQQMGLRSFAFHPDFRRPGRPGYRCLYTVSTETAGSRPAGVALFAGGHPVLHHDVVAEWKVYAGDFSRVDPTSRRELLRIAQWKSDHNTDQVLFDLAAPLGSADYGLLYFATGDGGKGTGFTDPYDAAQDGRLLLGKLCRIDPLAAGSARYRVPRGNPFVGRPGFRPEIFALGLRHPQNLCFDQRRLILTDIGEDQIEEVNIGLAGANYGWPLREGPFVPDRSDGAVLYRLPAGDAARGFVYPAAMYDHDDGRAITGGFVYRGSRIPALRGHYLCGDIVNGRIFHVPAKDLRPGGGAVLRELTLRRAGRTATLGRLVGTRGRVDLRFGQDGAGEVYVMTKQDGVIRRLDRAS